jgi:hypothetical protein
MLEDYPALSGIFDLFAEDEMSVFLDSSLQNELGQYSIVSFSIPDAEKWG